MKILTSVVLSIALTCASATAAPPVFEYQGFVPGVLTFDTFMNTTYADAEAENEKPKGNFAPDYFVHCDDPVNNTVDCFYNKTQTTFYFVDGVLGNVVAMLNSQRDFDAAVELFKAKYGPPTSIVPMEFRTNGGGVYPFKEYHWNRNGRTILLTAMDTPNGQPTIRVFVDALSATYEKRLTNVSI